MITLIFVIIVYLVIGQVFAAHEIKHHVYGRDEEISAGCAVSLIWPMLVFSAIPRWLSKKI